MVARFHPSAADGVFGPQPHWFTVLTSIFPLGMGLMLVAPPLRRFHLASAALAVGASIILALSAFGLVHLDPRFGQASIQADRRFYLLFLAGELPVLALALISLRNLKWAFWPGWAINLALAVYLMAIVIWLEFFWHW